MSAPRTSDCNQDAARAHGSSLQRLASPPDGFRMLTEGERTKRGDVFFMFGKWLPAKGYNAKWNSNQYWPMARRAGRERLGSESRQRKEGERRPLGKASQI